jgi:hypothetical protein
MSFENSRTAGKKGTRSAEIVTLQLLTLSLFKNSIIDKLTALGWGEEIEKIPHIDDIGNHRLVKQAQKLTERSK